jgi:hypothetical protein
MKMFPDLGGAFRTLLITSAIGLVATVAWLIVGAVWFAHHVRFA